MRSNITYLQFLGVALLATVVNPAPTSNDVSSASFINTQQLDSASIKQATPLMDRAPGKPHVSPIHRLVRRRIDPEVLALMNRQPSMTPMFAMGALGVVGTAAPQAAMAFSQQKMLEMNAGSQTAMINAQTEMMKSQAAAREATTNATLRRQQLTAGTTDAMAAARAENMGVTTQIKAQMNDLALTKKFLIAKKMFPNANITMPANPTQSASDAAKPTSTSSSGPTPAPSNDSTKDSTKTEQPTAKPSPTDGAVDSKSGSKKDHGTTIGDKAKWSIF